MSDLKTKRSLGVEVLASDFTQPWVLGLEHIEQEGSGAWQEIRERHGLSPEDIERLSESQVMWEEVHMLEDRPGLPSMAQLEFYARLESTSPGALLDRVLEEKGRQLMSEYDSAELEALANPRAPTEQPSATPVQSKNSSQVG